MSFEEQNSTSDTNMYSTAVASQQHQLTHAHLHVLLRYDMPGTTLAGNYSAIPVPVWYSRQSQTSIILPARVDGTIRTGGMKHEQHNLRSENENHVGVRSTVTNSSSPQNTYEPGNTIHQL